MAETITGQVSGNTARVQKVILPDEDDNLELCDFICKIFKFDSDSDLLNLEMVNYYLQITI